MKFPAVLAVLLGAESLCASPIEISPLPPPTQAVEKQSRTKLKHRTRPFFYGAIHTAVPNIIALNQQLPVGVKNASVRKQDVRISPVERNFYTVEGDLWRVTMEPNAIGRRRVVIDGRGKAHEFFFETDPHPYPLYSPQARAGSMYINSGTTNFGRRTDSSWRT